MRAIDIFMAAVVVAVTSLVYWCMRRIEPRYDRTFQEKASQTEPLYSRFWNIPELVLLVVNQLDRRDQASFAMACLSFRDLAIPLVWRTLVGRRHPVQVARVLPNRLKEMLVYGLDHLLLHVSVLVLRL